MATEMNNAPPQNGVREQANATELQEHGGVAHPGDARYAATPRLSSASWSAAS
jgi:hypothetical protein